LGGDGKKKKAGKGANRGNSKKKEDLPPKPRAEKKNRTQHQTKPVCGGWLWVVQTQLLGGLGRKTGLSESRIFLVGGGVGWGGVEKKCENCRSAHVSTAKGKEGKPKGGA